MMKHFCELRRDIPVIVTGSLVRLKILREAHKRGNYAQNSQFLFPVGKINQIYMYPLTFDEFLFNYNEALYDIVKTHYINKTQMECVQHKKLLDLINDYLFVGGMPEAVDAYLKNKDNINVYKIVTNKIKEIYDNYLADMDLYQASSESIVRSRLIYNDIYRQLNKENKNFKFSLTQEGAKGRDMINPIGWLTLAKIVNQSFLLKERITLPLIKEEDSLTRLYLSDVGMFTYQSGLNAKSFITNKDNSLSGIYYENFIASELSARNIGLFYWKGKRNAEFEFIISYDQKVIPIDVKRVKIN